MRKFIYLTVIGLLGLVYGYFFLAYQKFEAAWAGIPVWMLAIMIGAIVSALVASLRWVKEPSSETPGWLLVVPALGAALCIVLGLYFAEPDSRNQFTGGSAAGGGHVEYNYSQTRFGNWFIFHSGFGGGSSESSTSSGGSSSSSSKDGEGIAILIIVVLVLLVVILSAAVPHFWLVGALLCIGLALVLAYREWKYESEYAGYGGYNYRRRW